MTKQNRYTAEEGQISKSGKTIVRVAKSGRKYYHNPTKYREKAEEKRVKEGRIRGEYHAQRVKPLCHDKKSPAYMRYFEKKCKLREEYPKWVLMSREECRDYYNKLWELMQTDEDYQIYKLIESKTQEEKLKDQWWEQRKLKDLDYDGRGDEYGY